MYFTKAHGLGNDFIILNAKNLISIFHAASPLSSLWQTPHWHTALPDYIRRLSHRHTGIGCDQVIILDEDCHVAFFNADGTEAEMCFNGVRAAAFYLHIAQKASAFEPLTLHPHYGPPLCATITHHTSAHATVSVTVPAPHHQAFDAHATQRIVNCFPLHYQAHIQNAAYINVGNPHLVLQCTLALSKQCNIWDDQALAHVPQSIQTLPFFKNGVNITLLTQKAQSEDTYASQGEHVHTSPLLEKPTTFKTPFLSANHESSQMIEKAKSTQAPSSTKTLYAHVWERGTGPTLCCGTAAYASAVFWHMAQFNAFASRYRLTQPGGTLVFAHDEDQWTMCGDATLVYDGTFYT